MQKKTRRSAGWIIVAGFLLFAVTACAAPTEQEVCPAVGWINTVTVVAPISDTIVSVELCIAGECSSREAALTGSEADPDADADADAILPPVQTPTGWQFEIGMREPETATVRLIGSSGEVAVEGEVDIEWAPQSYGPCGGPNTGIVDLRA